MHLSEFKAWFEGFTDGITGIPSVKQWDKIKKRVSEITNDYTPSPIFIDRFVRPYRPYWHNDVWMSYCGGGVGIAKTLGMNMTGARGDAGELTTADYKTVSLKDWRAAGAAEFQAT